MITRKIENVLMVNIDNINLLTAQNIEFYVKQGNLFFEYTPKVISENEMLVTIPYDDAMKLNTGDISMQCAFTDANGNALCTGIIKTTANGFLKEAGYNV